MAGALTIAYYWRAVARYFATRAAAKIITAVLFCAVLGIVAWGIYIFFLRGFGFINADEFFRRAVLLYVCELFLLVICVMILASSFISAMFFLFRSSSDSWIMATPRFGILPRYIIGKIFVSAFWPLAVVVLPALLAVHSVFRVGVPVTILMGISVVLLLASIVVSAVIIVLAAARVLYAFKDASGKRLLTFSFLSVLVAGVLVFFSSVAWLRLRSLDIISVLRAQDLSSIAADSAGVADTFRFFPSHFAAEAWFGGTQGDIGMVATRLLLLALFLGTAWVLFLRAARWYLPVWQVLQEGKPSQSVRPRRARTVFPRFFTGQVGTVLEKEALVSVRTARDFLWFGFLLLLWVMQTGLNSFLNRTLMRYSIDPGSVSLDIQAIQAVTVVFFVCAFALRFAFPSLGNERGTAWILASAPIRMSRVFFAKFLLYSGLFTCLALVITLLNGVLLGLSGDAVAVSLGVFISSTIAVTAFSLGLSALFPNFDTDDPQMLSTSLPGLAFTVGSLLYGGVGALIMHAYFATGVLLPVILFFLFSSFLTAIFLGLGARAVQRTEFVKNIE